MAEFFTSTYKVPKYQRNYTWGEGEVGQLVDDLLEFSRSSESFYLLGDVIAAHSIDDDFKFELVDGQQRATTMCLVFLVLYKRLMGLGFDAVETNGLLNAVIVRKGKLRIQMSGKASDTALQFFDGAIENLSQETPSQKNVAEALDVISKRFEDAFAGVSNNFLLEFVERLLQQVYFGRLTLGDVEQATRFFERVNNRGVRLTNADLLKNRLLQNIKREEDYDSAAAVWASAEQLLMTRGKLGSVEYLLRQIRQADLKEKIKDSELYSKTKQLVESEAGCMDLVERIERKSPVLSEILQGNTPYGQEDGNSHGTYHFSFTQHIGVKLAGGHLNDIGYLHLSRRIEARSILSLLAGERPSAFEKDVPQWQFNLSQLPVSSDNSEVDAALCFDEQRMVDLLRLARTQFSTYRYDGTPGQQKRIRYYLAKANHLVNQRGPVENLKLADFLTTSKTSKKTRIPGFDIDHVHPKSRSEVPFEVHSIGNLTLLHSADNQEKAANEPSDAVTVYGHSKCYLTKALTSFPQTAQIEGVLAELRVAVADGREPWGPQQVTKRADLYFGLVASSLIADLGLALTYEEVFSDN